MLNLNSFFFFQAGTPLMILAGKDYGSGSSRDWAAKGPFLLGVKAVLAESYERIHRSNLVRARKCFPFRDRLRFESQNWAFKSQFTAHIRNYAHFC